MLLTEMAIRQAKPAPRAVKLFDGRGLFLLLQPTGSRYWRFKYHQRQGETARVGRLP